MPGILVWGQAVEPGLDGRRRGILGEWAQVFLLSPAHCGGRRAVTLIRPTAAFPLAQRLQNGTLSLAPAFGDRLCYPSAFVGRGDMSRGGLLLRCASSGVELDYVPLVPGAARRGKRPPRLEPLDPVRPKVFGG